MVQKIQHVAALFWNSIEMLLDRKDIIVVELAFFYFFGNGKQKEKGCPGNKT